MARTMSDYRVPPRFIPGLHDERAEKRYTNDMRSWVEDMIVSGTSFIEGQAAYWDIDKALAVLRGNFGERPPAGQSNISANRAKRQMREMIASLCNLRPMEAAHSSNTEYAKRVSVSNAMSRHWWLNTFADRKYREGVQYAAVLGTGYLSPYWDSEYYGDGEGEIAISTYGPSDVLPIQIGRDNDLQKAYAVVIRNELPLFQVQEAFPTKAHLITADRTAPGWLDRAMSRLRPRAPQGVMGVLNSAMSSVQGTQPVVDVFYIYVRDNAINDSGRKALLGQPGATWAYEVPSLGDDIPSGLYNAAGQMLYSKAGPKDCKLYPLRRLIIATRTATLSDDTSPWIHGKVPLVQLRLDDWAWDFLGFSVVRDIARLQAGINEVMRTVADSSRVRMRPPLKFDEEHVTPGLMDMLNTRKPGQHIAVNMAMGNVIEPVLPYQHWDIPAWISQWLGKLEDEMDYMAVVKDLTAMAKAKQIPSSDSIEKFFELAGPIVQDIARGQEKGTVELAQLTIPMQYQFYSTARKVRILGDDGFTWEDIDFDPGNMIPSHMPGESTARESVFPVWKRLRAMLSQYKYTIEPYSQAQVTRSARAAQMLMMYFRGFPISPWTVARSMNIDIGPKPKGTTNDMEEWVAFQHMQRELAQELQGAGGPGNPKGRPPSFQAGAQVKPKDGGTRSTISTSK